MIIVFLYSDLALGEKHNFEYQEGMLKTQVQCHSS